MNELLSRTRRLLTTCAAVLALFLAQGATAQQSTPVRSADFIVAVVNSEPITNHEVQAMRVRLSRELAARGGPSPSAAELTQQALDLLINEKAQLQLAQEQGIRIEEDMIDQAEANVASNNQLGRDAFRQRLTQQGMTVAAFREQLRHQLILSRLREREVDARIRITDLEIDQFLRDQSPNAQSAPAEINIGMILVTVPESASSAEVQALERQAQDIARRAREGENFAQLAKTYSQASDKGASGGEMGLRPADRYPDLFVEAIGSLPVQGIAGPIRSGAGFHILKLLERRQVAPVMTVEQTRARHILLRASPQLTREQAISRLQALRQQILSGRTPFAQAAREQSQDGSAPQGGDLGWANPGQFVPEFEQVMNRLQPGQISDPLVSRFGVHLVEVTERRKVAVPEREQREMARSALREKRMDEAYERWVDEVRGRAYVEMREAPEVQSLPGGR